VTGRLTTGLTRRYTMSTVIISVFVLQSVAALALPAAGQSSGGATDLRRGVRTRVRRVHPSPDRKS
jgi:hypothetical protein